MAKVNGTLFRLKVGNYIVGSTTNVTFNISQDNPLTTNQDSEQWETSLTGGGIRKGGGKISGLHDPDNNYNSEELIDVIIGNTGLLTVQVGVVGGTYYEFSAKLTNVELTGTMQEAMGVSADFASSGPITKGTTLSS